MTILLTGAAGFIGYHTAEALLARGETVIGIDNLNDYYDPNLKHARLERLEDRPGFSFIQMDITDEAGLSDLLQRHQEIDRIVHLAAQAGVRYSIDDPVSYIKSNILGQVILTEAALHLPSLKHMVYASSSSVYGANKKQPFSESDRVEHPRSIYAASKKSQELMAESYASLYGLPQTGLRFFTVYGPWGRPDMAYFSFTKKIFAGETIQIFNQGDMRRDFTYIDDIVAGVVAALDHPPLADPDDEEAVPHRVFNLGNNQPESLGDFVACIEKACGKEAVKDYQPMQMGDVKETYADIDLAQAELGFKPTISLEEGIQRFMAWYRDYYKV